jgi:hypothetical protein
MASFRQKTITLKSGEMLIMRSAEPDDAVRLLAYVRAVATETAFFILQADRKHPDVPIRLRRRACPRFPRLSLKRHQ